MRKSLTLIAAAVMVATSATAAERSGFYIGGDVGQSNWNVTQKDANDFAAAIAGELGIFYDTITPDKGKLSDTDTTYSLFVGYQFVPWLAVEASWMDLGNETIKASGRYDYPSPHPSLDPDYGLYSAKAKFESSGWAISALPMLPLGDSWNLFGRLGYYMGDNKVSASFAAQDYYTLGNTPVGAPYEAKDHKTDNSGSFIWGAGVSYTWNQRVSMRLEYDNVADVAETGGHKTDVERFTLGLVYRFGHVEEAALPVAAAPVAAPPPPPPPPPPAKCADTDNDGVCDSADKCPGTAAGVKVDSVGCPLEQTLKLLFDFDKSELRPESITELERLVKFMGDVPFAKAMIEGHTDSKGSDAYNQALSDRRAKAVFDYLTSRGVDPARLSSVGKGESAPIADNATDEGRQENRRVMLIRTDSGM